jgi:hypothetical protein
MKSNQKMSYFYFANDIKEKLRKENPDLTNKEIIFMIGNMWKNTPEIRAEYNKKFADDKKSFELELNKLDLPNLPKLE